MNLQQNDSGGLIPTDAGTIMEWRTVPGYPEFEVTKTGSIRENGGPARERVDGHGYIYVLRTKSRGALLVHRAVALAWHGLPKEGEVCRHKDDNPCNNHADNLAWGTKKENAADRKTNAPTRQPGWTEQRVLLERLKELEADRLALKVQNMKLKAVIFNFMADKNTRITQSLLKELGL